MSKDIPSLMFRFLRYAVLLSAVLPLVMAVANTSAQSIADPMSRPARRIPAGFQAVMLDITRAGDTLVSVGERGIVLFSKNNGKDWIQANVPVSVTLTAVSFVDERRGWAVGHSGIILHSDDGGENWVVQLNGVRAAELIAQQAEADTGPDRERRQRQAKMFLNDGADKPFLAVAFENEKLGFAVGAYGLAFRTEDGGATWIPWVNRVANPDGMNIYAIHLHGDTWTLAGEQGFFAQSVDDGRNFHQIKTPYRGSYFTLSAAGPGRLILGGLRGHAFFYMDATSAFEPIHAQVAATLVSSVTLNGGNRIFVNQAGQWLALRDHALSLTPTPEGAPANALAVAPDGTLWAATWRGLARFSMLQDGEAGKPEEEAKK
jgi:photosystem II stability/assembly factor-like uncharacterized protein